MICEVGAGVFSDTHSMAKSSNLPRFDVFQAEVLTVVEACWWLGMIRAASAT